MEVIASGVVQIYYNGVSAIIGPNSTWLKADANGVLNLIIPTKGIVCYTIQVVSILPDNEEVAIPVDTTTFDPSHKAASKLAAIKTAQDLWNARTHDGKAVVPPNSITSVEADAIAAGICNAMTADESFAVNPAMKIPRQVVRRPRHIRFGWFSWWNTLVDLWNKGVGYFKKGLKALTAELTKIDDMGKCFSILSHMI